MLGKRRKYEVSGKKMLTATPPTPSPTAVRKKDIPTGELPKPATKVTSAKWKQATSSVLDSLPALDVQTSNRQSNLKSPSENMKNLLNSADVLDRIIRYWPKGRRAGARGARGTTGIFSTRDPPTDEEVKFLEAAEYGNIPTVRKMLDESTTFSVNCVDFMGQNALQLAVGNEHLEVVELLLKQPVMARIGDALLLAISKGYVRIAEIILNHPSFQVHDRLTRSPCEQRLMNQKEEKLYRNMSVPIYAATQADHERLCKDTDFYAYDEDGTRFSPDITPIILAAQCQEYEIVHELLMRGARIERPHNYQCTCEECLFRKKLDSFSYSLSRINAYKGLASPAYLSLSSSDPVLTGLELSHELQQLANIEKEFKKEYHDLAAQCDDFAERLLDLCHDTEEVEVILNGDMDKNRETTETTAARSPDETSSGLISSDTPFTSGNDVEGHQKVATTSSFTYSNNNQEVVRSRTMPQLKRLKKAIRYSVKGFVAHPNCQQQLLRLWQRNLSWLWQSPFYCKFFFAAGVTLCMPVLALIYIFAPCTKAATLIRSPFCKFISHAMSYAQFLCLLVVNSSDRFEGGFIPSWFLVHQSKEVGRFTIFTWCEVLIMLYVLGFLWNECHEVFDEGPREYMFKMWNIIDFFMLSIFLSSYALRAISYYKVSAAQDWWDKEYGENATMIFYDNENRTLQYMYGNCDRCGRLLNRTVDPSLGYYAYMNAERKYWKGSDPQLISEALFSFGIVLSFSRIAYILPANEMFGPLQISLGRTVADIVKWIVIFFMIFGAFLLGLFNLYSYYGMPGAKKSKAFTTLEHTFINLFWSMFGLAEYKGVELEYPHAFTRLVGYQLYGAYNIISVIIMLNMLIAMINSSYSDVEKDADVEWKFARAKLWLSYFDDGKTLPVPYNIIPSPKSAWVNCCRIYGFFKNLCLCKLFKNKSRPIDSVSKIKRQRPNMRQTVSMSSFGTSVSAIGKKQNGMRRSETVQETARRWRGLSMKSNKEQLTRYQIIMRRIVKRFVIRAQVEKDRDEVNEGELQEIKHDISSLRFELLESNASYADQIRSILELLQRHPSVRESVEPNLLGDANIGFTTIVDQQEVEEKSAPDSEGRSGNLKDELGLQRRKVSRSASAGDEKPAPLWARPRSAGFNQAYGRNDRDASSVCDQSYHLSRESQTRRSDSLIRSSDGRRWPEIPLKTSPSSPGVVDNQGRVTAGKHQQRHRRSAYVPPYPIPEGNTISTERKSWQETRPDEEK